MIEGIQEAVTIPVMAKARIGHFAEAQVLEALEVDYIDESEVLTPADEAHHIDKWAFKVPFVCGATNLGEALRRIGEGAAMIRSKGEAGTGDIVEAVRHLRAITGEIRRLGTLDEAELLTAAKELQRADRPRARGGASRARCPSPMFCAGGIATPADASLVMQLGAEARLRGLGHLQVRGPGSARRRDRRGHDALRRPRARRRGVRGTRRARWRRSRRASSSDDAGPGHTAAGSGGRGGAAGSSASSPSRATSRRTRRLLRALGAEVREVRAPADLDGLDGLVLPGGESTTMTLGIEREGLAEPLRALAASGTPVLGTCAGLILLDREHLGVMDIAGAAQRLRAPGALLRGGPRPSRTSTPDRRCTRSSSARRGSRSTAPSVEVLAQRRRPPGRRPPGRARRARLPPRALRRRAPARGLRPAGGGRGGPAPGRARVARLGAAWRRTARRAVASAGHRAEGHP